MDHVVSETTHLAIHHIKTVAIGKYQKHHNTIEDQNHNHKFQNGTWNLGIILFLMERKQDVVVYVWR